MRFRSASAALLVRDAEAADRLVPEALALLLAPQRLDAFRAKIAAVEKHDAANEIVEQIVKYIPNPESSRNT